MPMKVRKFNENVMNIKKSDTVGMTVATRIETANVFNYYGINFYSKGNRTLEEVCIEENVPIISLFEDLCQIQSSQTSSRNFLEMNAKELIAYIVRTHHRFTERKLVFIKHTLENMMIHHEWEGTFLERTKKAFEELSVYLTVHMNHEELIVFPIIVKMTGSKTITPSEYRAIAQPIAAMRADHELELEKLKKLGASTQRSIIEKKNDHAYTICYNAMMELENDLKIHMHLENNVLFPKAIDFAQRITHKVVLN